MRVQSAIRQSRLRHASGAPARWRYFSCGGRLLATTTSARTTGLDRTRNIGIIAHIDAGKTTTTERMLYYSGHTRRIGNVDEGSTVTDFLPTERERGVTIQSAAITFNWPPLDNENAPRSTRLANIPPHNINLIDTPGHADFTFEVLRSLRILDGAICILDGVAGVEAQTEKVWTQADRYGIPRIIYINKLDRDGASFANSVRSIGAKLRVQPALCQIPWWIGSDRQFCGIGDPVNIRAVRWAEGDGTQYDILDAETLQRDHPQFLADILEARKVLIENLVENEEEMLEKYVEAGEDASKIKSQDILQSLRKCVLDPSSNLVPVFAGSSFQNVGVQPLLDAIVQLLPNPDEVREAHVRVGESEGKLHELMNGSLLASDRQQQHTKSLQKRVSPSTALIANLEACALAFKVVNDSRHGTLIYVRVYSGVLRRATDLFNTNLKVTEKAQWLLKMYASESAHVDEIPAGQIGVIPGLKSTRTGDTLISYKKFDPRKGPPPPISTIQLRPIDIPPAMFSASVEPHSAGDQRSIREALNVLTREDPSLQVTEDEESCQTLLNGMGEFHLEIAQDRLLNHFKVNASMGKIEIAYREAIVAGVDMEEYTFERTQGGVYEKATCFALVEPLEDYDESKIDLANMYSTVEEGNRITMGVRLHSNEDITDGDDTKGFPLPANVPIPLAYQFLKNGAMAGLGRGVKYAYQMHKTHVKLALESANPRYLPDEETVSSAVSSAARIATKRSLQRAAQARDPIILEPIMNVVVSVDEPNLGAVANDLTSSRGGQVLSLEEDFEEQDQEDQASLSTVTATRIVGNRPKIDVDAIYVPPDPFASSSESYDGAKEKSNLRTVKARVPLKEMIGYLKHLSSLTAGRGSFVMAPYQFQRVVGLREKNLLKEMRGGI